MQEQEQQDQEKERRKALKKKQALVEDVGAHEQVKKKKRKQELEQEQEEQEKERMEKGRVEDETFKFGREREELMKLLQARKFLVPLWQEEKIKLVEQLKDQDGEDEQEEERDVKEKKELEEELEEEEEELELMELEDEELEDEELEDEELEDEEYGEVEEEVGEDGTYPTKIPTMYLNEDQKREKYGLKVVPVNLKKEIRDYLTWCSNDMQLDRPYPTNQVTSIVKTDDLILAYLGYIQKYHPIHTNSLTLGLYANPVLLTKFLGYLKARGVGGEHMYKHATLTKKIVIWLNQAMPTTYLNMNKPWTSDGLLAWLGNLQVRAA